MSSPSTDAPVAPEGAVASPSQSQAAALPAVKLEFKENAGKVQHLYETERDALMEINGDEKINLGQTVIDTVARLSILNSDSLNMIRTDMTFYPLPTRQELVNETDAARGNSMGLLGDLAAATFPINEPEQCVKSFLMPGEEIVAQVPFSGISVMYENKHDSGMDELERGEGRFVITNKRLLIYALDKDVYGERMNKPDYLASVAASPVLAKLQRRRRDLQRQVGFIGTYMPCFNVCCGSGRQTQLAEVERQIENEMAKNPMNSRRNQLQEILRLLKPGRCCTCSCGIDCVKICCGKPAVEDVIKLEQTEDVNVVPINLDRLVYARLTSTSQQAGATLMKAENVCCSFNCCSCAPCAKTKVTALPEKPLKQGEAKKAATIVLSLLMPPWNKPAHISFAIGSNVPYSALPAIIAQLQARIPAYNIVDINDGKTGVKIKPAEGPFSAKMQ